MNEAPSWLNVYYDETCGFCRRCRDWLATEAMHLPVALVPGGRRRELTVMADDGRVWEGSAAFVMCLWATVRHRPLSTTLRRPALKPLATFAFRHLSARRHTLARVWSAPPTVGAVAPSAGPPTATCGTGACG